MGDRAQRHADICSASRSVAVGAIVALRLFDVAYAIDLARAETLLAEQARASQPQPADRDAAQGDGVRRAAGGAWHWTRSRWSWTDSEVPAGVDRAAVRFRRGDDRLARAGRRHGLARLRRAG